MSEHWEEVSAKHVEHIAAGMEELTRFLRMILVESRERDEPTLRDEFAMAAMTGDLANPEASTIGKTMKDYTSWCYEMADAMLKARVE